MHNVLFPADIATFQLPGAVGELEVLTEMPIQDLHNIVAIICHPHPLFGGTMKNKVVSTLARAFKDMHIPTVRFNFRGVGKSAGQFAEGVGEVDDLCAILEWVKQVKPDCRIWLSGFSFGSSISAKVASLGEGELLVNIAPPVMRWGFDRISTMPCPWLVVQGEQDEVISAPEVIHWFASQHPEAKMITMPEATHFFHGHLIALREILMQACSPYIPAKNLE